MTSPRPNLPPIPPRVALLPLNERGYPVPWFVAWVRPYVAEGVPEMVPCSSRDEDARPDFRVIRAGAISSAMRDDLCWICGERLGTYRAFVIGPMCAVNRVSSEPPSHEDCARFAAMACPFLTVPKMERREGHLPAARHETPGIAIDRNPGAALVWFTNRGRYSIFPARRPDGVGGVLFSVGEPTAVEWYAEGQRATRKQALASVESGLPILREMAEKEGPRALEDLLKMIARAETWYPKETDLAPEHGGP